MVFVQDVSIAELVNRLNAEFIQMWWACSGDLPAFARSQDAREQERNEQRLARLVDGLIHEVNHLPADAPGRAAMQARLGRGLKEAAAEMFGFTVSDLNFIEASGLLEAGQEFARMARRFDPAIPGEDIYQAARNVMSMNLIQLLMNLPVAVTPPVFAYSMLYPYTDNYLDDPLIPWQVKRDFNARFLRRLQGEPVWPENRHEEIISELVGMIENHFDRARFPQVWDSLIAIHAAQGNSLKLVAPGASPYEVDVLSLTFEKGGVSVLADGYLVAGWVSPLEAAFFYGYGAFTQLMDDLEDVDGDRRAGRLTIFSQTASHWPLDAITNRAIHFGRKVFEKINVFQSPAVEPLRNLIARGLDPILIDIVGRAGKYYTPAYRRALERVLPFRFEAVRKQRARLERHKVSLGRLVEAWI